MKRSSTLLRSLVALAMAFVLSGCGTSSSGGGVTAAAPVFSTSAPAPSTFAYAQFDPNVGTLQAIPHPVDALLRNPSTGVNNLSSTTSAAAAFNTLSGFSTSAPIYVPFLGRLNASTVNASNIMVVNASNQPQQMSFTLTTDGTNDTLALSPVRPLAINTPFTVIVTNRVLSSSGEPLLPVSLTRILQGTAPIDTSSGDPTALQIEALRAAWQPTWTQAEAASGLPRTSIPMAFTFTTQNLYSTLQLLNADVQAQPAPTPQLTNILGLPANTFFGTVAVDGFFTALGQSAIPHAAIGGVYTGTFPSPNYISYTDPNPANSAGAPWVLSNNLPVVQSTRTQQFICLLPNPTNFPLPGGGYPTVIYVHGITRNMLDCLAVANTFNSQGIAVIAINMPLHGSNTLIPANAYQNSATGDGFEYINLNNLQTGRDNLRQSAADQYQLIRMLTAGNTNIDSANYANQALLAPNPGVLGQSLGSIVGTLVVSTDGAVDVSVLNVAGGRIGSLLQNSPTFTPTINAALAAAGVPTGSSAYQDFFWIAQTVLDDGDSFNYGQFFNTDTIRGSNTGRPRFSLVQEMINDQTVPNSATTDLARAMNLQQAYAKSPISGLTQVSGASVQGSSLYQFTGGAHGFLIDGTATTVPCQTQVLTYFGQYFASNPGGPTITNIQPKAEGVGVGTPWLDYIIRPDAAILGPARR